MHYAMKIKENNEQNLDIWPNLTCFFRSWWFSVLPLGRLCFGFDVITIYSRFVTSYDPFKQIWIVVDVIQHFLSDGHTKGVLVKIQQLWNELCCHTLQTQNIRKNCMAWANRYADILRNFSNSDLTILYNNFLHCFSVFIGCWCAGPSWASVVIHLFSTFCEELVLLVNTFLTYSTLTVCHFQHFKCFWALNSIFYTKFYAYSLIHCFQQQKIANTRKTLLTFIPLINKQKMLYCWNCEHTFGTSVPT